MSQNFEIFLEQLQTAFQENTLVKLTLSKTTKAAGDLKNLYAKKAIIRKIPMLSFTLRYETRDETKNFEWAAAKAFIEEHIAKNFHIATLLTTQEDLVWTQKGDKLQRSKASKVVAPQAAHNKEKQYAIAEDAPFLQYLDISSSNGKVYAQAQDKYRQINKYVEIMDTYFDKLKTENGLSIVDMGCGKGYLTFALFEHWKNKINDLKMIGVELREQLTKDCNKIAQSLDYSPALSFKAQDIMSFDNKDIDVLIALHACDIATDIAIAKGILASAQLIVVAPCCHKQIRRALSKNSFMQPILKHGILLERQAELITDGIRALLLEANGYRTQVFEFISSLHTAKNVLIVAQYTGIKNEAALVEIENIKSQFGLEEHYLQTLLGGFEMLSKID